MRQNNIHCFAWADQDWIGPMIFKNLRIRTGSDSTLWIRIGLGLKNFTVRSSLQGAQLPRCRIILGALKYCGGAEWLQGRQKISTMSHVHSSIQYIWFPKDLGRRIFPESTQVIWIRSHLQKWADCENFQSQSSPDPMKLNPIQSWSTQFLKIISPIQSWSADVKSCIFTLPHEAKELLELFCL